MNFPLDNAEEDKKLSSGSLVENIFRMFLYERETPTK